MQLSVTYPDKYDDDMFYIAPFYHRIFPQVSRLITVDVDVEFHVDPAQLYRQFDHFGPDAVVAAANDLAPHYHQGCNSIDFLNFGQKIGAKLGQILGQLQF